jgi:hypothetical protein
MLMCLDLLLFYGLAYVYALVVQMISFPVLYLAIFTIVKYRAARRAPFHNVTE